MKLWFWYCLLFMDFLLLFLPFTWTPPNGFGLFGVVFFFSEVTSEGSEGQIEGEMTLEGAIRRWDENLWNDGWDFPSRYTPPKFKGWNLKMMV